MSDQATSISHCTLYSHDKIPLTCDHRGEGKPLLVFIHGWTCRRSYWRPQLDFFCDKHSVAAFDLPGHGDSPSGDRTNWGIFPFALDVAACVNQLNVAETILVGHSMGGAVALEAARLLGTNLKGVVLVDTFAIDYCGLPTETVQAIAAPFEKHFSNAVSALVEQTSTAATPHSLKQQLIQEMAAADPTWALSVWRDLLAWNPQAAFNELQIPIHAINGSLIPETARERCAPFVNETIIPDAGHFLQMEDPTGFNIKLEKVLNLLR